MGHTANIAMSWTWLNAGANDAFSKRHNVFLIGESYLAWRNCRSRGNVQKELEDLGFNVENFAQNGVTLSNFWWKSHMSWDKWNRIQRQDAMIISIGFNQLSDLDLNSKDEAEVRNIVQQALEKTNHVILIVPNQPLLEYFTVRAHWYIERQRDDLNEPNFNANALKRQQLYASRFQKLVKLIRRLHSSHRMLRIVEMHSLLTPADICDDGCHLNHQGAAKTADAITQALKSQRLSWCGKRTASSLAYILISLLGILMLKVMRSSHKHILHK